MTTRCFKTIDVTVLTIEQIQHILKVVPTSKYIHQEKVIKVANFDHAQLAHSLVNGYKVVSPKKEK